MIELQRRNMLVENQDTEAKPYKENNWKEVALPVKEDEEERDEEFAVEEELDVLEGPVVENGVDDEELLCGFDSSGNTIVGSWKDQDSEISYKHSESIVLSTYNISLIILPPDPFHSFDAIHRFWNVHIQ